MPIELREDEGSVKSFVTDPWLNRWIGLRWSASVYYFVCIVSEDVFAYAHYVGIVYCPGSISDSSVRVEDLRGLSCDTGYFGTKPPVLGTFEAKIFEEKKGELLWRYKNIT